MTEAAPIKNIKALPGLQGIGMMKTIALLAVALLFGVVGAMFTFSSSSSSCSLIFQKRMAFESQYKLPFDIRECTGIYLDVGSNKGVQVRKLFDPKLFPQATITGIFSNNFPDDRTGVCAIGFEPNPQHKPYLEELEENLRCRGHKVHFFTETAVTATDGKITFFRDTVSEARYNEWGASLLNWQHKDGSKAESVEVQGMDFSTFLLHQVLAPFGMYPITPESGDDPFRIGDIQHKTVPTILMKMDIEGGEFELLPKMLSTGALCAVDHMMIEWHAHFLNTNTTAKDQMMINMGHALGQYLENAASMGSCKTKIVDLDDESYVSEVMSIPHKPCSRKNATNA